MTHKIDENRTPAMNIIERAVAHAIKGVMQAITAKIICLENKKN